MKNKIHFYLFTAVTITCFLFSNCGTSKNLNDSQIKTRIDSLARIPKINFKANQAIPTSFKPVTLTYGYNVRITKDTVECYLPYYGRAYTSSYENMDDTGIKFVSTNFDYKMELQKKGAYNITIKPRDSRKKYILYLTVESSGYGSLQVTDPDRQPISFYGTIDY